MACPECGAENRAGARFCDTCGAALAEPPPAREQRKTVTVLFCDVTGSTALGERLDPEALRATMARYFDAARAAIERHGGTVEKFIGDAVMAVFGVPQVHEDDALRAVRAAVELRDAVEVDIRVGVNTGEVVTGSGDSLVTGDAVNVAARLEQAAQPGEVFIGADTYGLVRDAVEVELLPPLEAKGKSRPVTAYRLVAVTGEEAHRRRLDAPLVGRAREGRLLADAWDRVRSERSCALFTILGAAGVGKSRLAREFLGTADATVLVGRCLSYGEGITYWPVVEVVKQLLGAEEPSEPAISALLGDGHASADEIAFAVRKLLEARAAERPVVLLFDDVNWGEPTFLDLVEHVADWSRDAPILLLCLARPELLDRRPGWGGGKLNATTVLLEPLAPDETDELIEGLLGEVDLDPGLRARILLAAEGNPLFVEEMLAMVSEQGGEGVTVPPTIQALLAARIDQLPPPERSALERGAVEGQVFHRGAVEALAPDEPHVASHLMGLVRKELVRPSAAVLPGDDAFRFRHLLIRDAAYDALPKATRADLHERFAVWVGEHGADLVELDEILGYHLEQAALYRAELGRPAPELAARAAELLGGAGLRAFDRIDLHAAANLLGRAVDLYGPEEPRHVALLAREAEAIYGMGEIERCLELLEVAAERGDRLGDHGASARARLFGLFVRAHVDGLAAIAEDVDALLSVIEASGNAENLAQGYIVRGWFQFWVGRNDAAIDDAKRALEIARDNSLRAIADEAAGLVLGAMRWGGTPWAELERFVEERLAEAGPSFGGRMGAGLRDRLGGVLAARGEFDAARGIYAELRQSMLERGTTLFLHTVAMEFAAAELLSEDWAAAERMLWEAWDGLAAAGERGFRSTVGYLLALAIVRQGRLDEAAAIVDESEQLTSKADFTTQAGVGMVRALIASAHGRHDEAVRLAQDAYAEVGRTEYLEQKVDAHLVLSEVLLAAGRGAEAEAPLRAAVELADAKGSLVLAARARGLLRQVSESEPAA